MFTVTLAIYNPFSKGLHRHVATKSYVYGNKAVEFNFYRTSTLLRFDTSLMLYGDHRPEFYITVGLLGFDFELNLYDKRHFSEEILY